MEMPKAQKMLKDIALKIGPRRPNKTRPIVVNVITLAKGESYDKKEALKQASVGVGVHWSQQVTPTHRNPKPQDMKLVRDKLYINCAEYNPAQQDKNA